MGQKAVFLDRDGTLNREVHYLSRAEDFEWLKGSIEAAKDLQTSGIRPGGGHQPKRHRPGHAGTG